MLRKTFRDTFLLTACILVGLSLHRVFHNFLRDLPLRLSVKLLHVCAIQAILIICFKRLSRRETEIACSRRLILHHFPTDICYLSDGLRIEPQEVMPTECSRFERA